jgi:hypothetical protein
VNEEAMAHGGLSRQKPNKRFFMYKSYNFSFLHYVHVGSFTTPAAAIACLRIFAIFISLE